MTDAPPVNAAPDMPHDAQPFRPPPTAVQAAPPDAIPTAAMEHVKQSVAGTHYSTNTHCVVCVVVVCT